MKKYKKILYIFLILVTGILAIFAIATAYKYFYIVPSDKIENVKFQIHNQNEIKLGEQIQFTANLESDWKTKPLKLEFELPDGLQSLSEKKFKIKKLKWGKTLWQIELILQAYKPGYYAGIKGQLILVAKNSKNIETVFSTESFTVSEIPNLNESSPLEIAGKIDKKSKIPRYFLLALAILIIALIAFAIFAKKRKKSKTQIRLPCWVIALTDLNELRISQKKNLISGILCVTKLCDIIRNYLQERFKINAPQMTSEEFLINLKKGDSPLSEENKIFLNNFMESSDMVKFAKMPVDSDMIENAIIKAEELVRQTTPNETKEKRKK